jgi:hypothetical protein
MMPGPGPKPTGPTHPTPTHPIPPARQQPPRLLPVGAPAGEPVFHDPDREGAGGWPPGPPPHPRPQSGAWPVMPGTAAVAALINAEIARRSA